MAPRHHAALALAFALTASSTAALAQPKAPPGGKKPDMEVDLDKPKEPPPPLPPVQPGQWGVGGKEEEGRFVPGDDKKKQEAAEQAKKEAEEAKKPVDLGLKRLASVDTVVAFGSMRDVLHDAHPTTAGGVSFVFGFSWRFFDIWNLGVRLPFSRISTTGDAGAFNTFALGNFELMARPTFQLSRTWRLPAQISIFIPTAQGDFFPDPAASDKNVGKAQALVNQAASWSRGWEEMPLFATRRFGLRFGVGTTWDSGNFHANVGTKLDLMIRMGGGDAYAENPKVDPTIPELRTLALAWQLGGSFSYAFLNGMVEPTLRAWVAYATQPVGMPTRDYSGAQFVLEPAVNGRFPVVADKSMAVKAGLGVILPLGGPLGTGGGGTAYSAAIKGFRINAGFEF
jgi:hypothetical protein